MSLDDALAALLANGCGPALTATVLDRGTVRYAGTAGRPDIADPAPTAFTPDHRFRIGSLTKTYIATLVTLLFADGDLAPDDRVAKLLPEYDVHADLTVEHLLRLRSGLTDYLEPLFGDPPDFGVYQRYHRPADLIRLTLSLPVIEPDRAWCYSNGDYVLLGEIVERVTEAPLPVVLWQRILEPLGLRDTEYPLADPYVRGPHLPGYTRFAGRYHDTSVISPSESGASGAMISNASEVARFFEAVVHGDLVPSPWAARMRAAVPSQDGLGYGYGLSRLALPDGTIAYGHRGGTAGSNTVVLATEAGRTVVLHQNALDLQRPLRWDNPFLLAALDVSL